MHMLSLCDDRSIAAVEKVGAMPGQGVTSMFSFGQSFGFILGVLTAFGIPYQLVPPRKWKTEFGLINTEKQDSVTVAKRLFPGVSLLPTERCRKESDGMSDSLLLAEYARRHFGEGYVE
jgi:crossover junction endodeoxyribonuclease RuvC